jgi:hypothetical protein
MKRISLLLAANLAVLAVQTFAAHPLAALLGPTAA